MPPLDDRANIEAFLSAHDPIVEPTLFAIGDEIGAWKIAAFLGRGGSGEVYRVTHRQLGVVAAIKILSRDDDAARNRFRREARILAEHSHPVFPRFLDYGELGNHAYLVIELLEAMPLPNKDREVARYLYKVCEGVAYLHGLGLVHRDIKPQNVLQRGATGQPVLIDLGLVKDTTLSPVHEGVSLSIVDGQARGVGTPKYSAPEQFAGGKISPAADVHALGMLANECFGGNPPRSWERIIRRSTSSIPTQRYASVAEFVQAIRKRHGINVLIFVLVPFVLLILAATIQLSWHYAIQSGRARSPIAPDSFPAGRARSPSAPDSFPAGRARSPSAPDSHPVGRAVSMRPPPAPSSTNRVALSSAVAADVGDFIEVALPDGQPKQSGRPKPRGRMKQGGVTNKVFMVPDDDHPKPYPKAGVFVGDHDVDPNF